MIRLKLPPFQRVAATGLFAIVASFLFASFLWDRHVYQELKGEWQSESATLVQSRQGWLPDIAGEPAAEMTFTQGHTFVSLFREKKSTLERLIFDIKTGRRMTFWYQADRSRTADEMQHLLDADEKAYRDLSQALDCLAEEDRRVGQSVKFADQTRENILETLKPESDENDFTMGVADADKAAIWLKTMVAEVRARLSEPQFYERAEAFRISILRGMLHMGLSYLDSMNSSKQAMLLALTSLRQYKANLDEILSVNGNLVSGLSFLGASLKPGIDFAFEHTRPLRQMLSESRTPFVSRNSALSALFSSSSSTTPLALAVQQDPQVAVGVDTLDSLCSGVEMLKLEVDSLVDRVGEFEKNMENYRQAHSRVQMLFLVSRAGPTRSYFDEKKALFNDPIEKLQHAQSYFGTLRQIAGNIRVPFVGVLLQNLAGGGESIVGALRVPLDGSRGAMQSTALAMVRIQNAEAEYLAALNGYKTNKISVPQQSSALNDHPLIQSFPGAEGDSGEPGSRSEQLEIEKVSRTEPFFETIPRPEQPKMEQSDLSRSLLQELSLNCGTGTGPTNSAHTQPIFQFQRGCYGYITNAPSGLNNFVLTIKFRIDEMPDDNEYLVGKGIDRAPRDWYRLFLIPSVGGARLHAEVANSDQTIHIQTQNIFRARTWYEVILMYDRTGLRVNVDGQEMARDPNWVGPVGNRKGEALYVGHHDWQGGSSSRLSLSVGSLAIQ